VYTVVPDPPQDWRVRARRGHRGRAGFPDQEAAVAHAERLAARHLVAQIQVFGSDGSLQRDEARFDEERCREAEAFLEAHLAPFRDVEHALAALKASPEVWYYAENRDVAIAGETVRLTVGIHEGSMWDEIYVHGSIWDEWLGPRIAEIDFVLWPHGD
jgi:hypothetical protein